MNKRIFCSAALIGAVLAAPAWASETDELRARIDRLESELSSMKQQRGDDWLTEQRSEEIRDLVQNVLADADTRASLLQSGMTAGYDGGFMIGSTDGAFLLKMNGQIQVRHNSSFRDQGNTDIDESRRGFEIRRAKLKFKGHVVDKTWKYVINGAHDRNGGRLKLEDAIIIKDFENGWKVWAGQFKGPLLREELVSSSRQLTVDRSLLNEYFNADRSQGVQVEWAPNDRIKLWAMYGDGINSDNTPWQIEDTEYAFTTRAEYLAMGEWKQFKDFTSKQGSETAVLIGAAIHYEVAEYGTTNGPEEKDFRVTIDASVEGDGWNAFGYFVYQDLDEADQNPLGFLVQGGVYVTQQGQDHVRPGLLLRDGRRLLGQLRRWLARGRRRGGRPVGHPQSAPVGLLISETDHPPAPRARRSTRRGRLPGGGRSRNPPRPLAQP
jgi:hypothetical protein